MKILMDILVMGLTVVAWLGLNRKTEIPALENLNRRTNNMKKYYMLILGAIVSLVCLNGTLIASEGDTPTRLPGWPYGPNDFVKSSPTVADIDNDGDFEIVVGSYDKKIYALHHDGTLVIGWPYQTNGVIAASPAIADIDNDGDLEIVAGSCDKKIYALHNDGTLVSGWPYQTNGFISSSPVIADIDNDGNLEIIVGSCDKKIYALHHDGTLVFGWPYQATETIGSSPAIGDIDNDGYLEIITSSVDRKIYALRNNGTLVPGWPYTLEGNFGGVTNSSPVIADIDNDSYLEVLIGAIDNKVYCIRHDGTSASGWPYEAIAPLGAGTAPAAAIADINNDGYLEVVISSYRVDALRLNGKLSLTKLPWPMFAHDIQHKGYYILQHLISVTLTGGGTIDPTGEIIVSHGASQTFTMAPDTGYEIADILVDGTSVGAVTSYTLSDISEDHSIIANFRSIATVPAPTNLRVNRRFAILLGLVWDASRGANGYEVWSKEDAPGAVFSLRRTVATPLLTDAILKDGTMYCYKVRAYKQINQERIYSDFTTELKEATTLNGPYGLTLTKVAGGIKLNWRESSQNETEFRIERTENTMNGFVEIKALPGNNITTYTDTTGLVKRRVYYYRVKSKSSVSESEYSNIRAVRY